MAVIVIVNRPTALEVILIVNMHYIHFRVYTIYHECFHAEFIHCTFLPIFAYQYCDRLEKDSNRQ